jgi:hypothetical protein
MLRVCTLVHSHYPILSASMNHIFLPSAATMISIPKTALFASLMSTTSLVSASTSTKSFGKGYGATVYASFAESCEVIHYSSFNVYAYSNKNRFITKTGNSVIKESSKFDDLSISYTESSCDNSTITYRYGNIYDQSNYGNSVPTKFTMETKNLKEAEVKNLELPIFENTCTYECTEVCYPYYMGYGTCPETEFPYLECYTTSCGEDQPLGVAQVSVTWDAAAGTSATPPVKSRSSFRETGPGYSYDSKSSGSYRYELDIVITATLNGSDLFLTTPDYVAGDLSSTNSKTVSKSDYQAEFRRRMRLLEGN